MVFYGTWTEDEQQTAKGEFVFPNEDVYAGVRARVHMCARACVCLCVHVRVLSVLWLTFGSRVVLS